VKLICSRGCEFDTSHLLYSHMKAGDKCPSETGYDRLRGGVSYCRRVLYPAPGETSVLLAIANDSASYGTNDQIHHLIVSNCKHKTLCGVSVGRWLTQPTNFIGSATLCARCERIAEKRRLAIPE
jgi:hypothetical protein